MPRALLLMPATSYRAHDFLEAARKLDIDVVVGSNHRPVLERLAEPRTLTLDFRRPDAALAAILDYAKDHSIAAVLGTDDATTLLAAEAGQALGLIHTPPSAVADARDKYRFRCAMARAGRCSPWFRLLHARDDPRLAATSIVYPCVLKPRDLGASRGVIRANDAAGFIAARARIFSMLRSDANGGEDTILTEGFIPGREIALEGVLNRGRLKLLALFDKPDPLDGPYFEETLYVTPSRLAVHEQRAILEEVSGAARALGLQEGPVHAELRINALGVSMIELAPRSIGGLCSRTLVFSQGMALEELLLRHSLGYPIDAFMREDRAAGVMMIPIRERGRLLAVHGVDAAAAVPGIEDIIIGIPLGDELIPLPEGDRYLGFIFARARHPAEVESALREAYRCLSFAVQPA